MKASTDTVADILAQDRVVYGINTGFGLLANTRIELDDLETLQRSIVLSHAAGIGEFMDDATVRLMIVLKIASLARGYSGIRFEVVKALAALVNREVYPCIPKKGSVGASGDLAPLAHMSTVLLGEGQARYKGEVISGEAALKIAGLSPITLGPKEGLALLNGTQASTAFALEAYLKPKTCMLRLPFAVHSRWRPHLAVAVRLTRAFMPYAAIKHKWMPLPLIVTCWPKAARLVIAIKIVKRYKILIHCAANHK